MTTFYVDNSSLAASDSNAGTSIDAPLLSLAGINAMTFHPGDVIAFKAGTTYSVSAGNAGALQITSSGTADAPITFTSYGDGPKPIIDNTAALIYSDAVLVKGASYVQINGLAFGQAARAGVNIDAASSHVTVSNTEASNVGEGLLVNGHDNLVTQNYIHDLHMVKNTPTSVANNDDYGANGVVVGGSNNEFSYNRIVNAKAASYDYGTDGGGFEISGNVNNVSIHNNWVENSEGFLEAGGLGDTITNVSVSNNISLNNGSFATIHNNGGAFGASYQNLVMQGNTIVEQLNGAKQPATVFLDGPATAAQVNFINNTVALNNGDSVYKQPGDYHSGNTYYLQSAATHLYNSWSMTLGQGETLVQAAANVSALLGQATTAANASLIPAATASAAQANVAPVVTATAATTVVHGTSMAVGSLFTSADANGDAAVKYDVVDVNTSVAGHLTLGGVTQANGQVIEVTAAQLGSIGFTAGYGSDEVHIRAYDGQAWSAWASTTITGTNFAPTLTVANKTMIHGTSVSGASLFTYADRDGDAATTYQVIDTSSAATSGHFVLNGVAQANGQSLQLTAGQLSSLTYQAGIGTDSVQIRAYDGGAWSTWATLTATGTNAAPVTAAVNKAIAHGGTIAASSLFTTSDADGDAIVSYQITDLNNATDSGHFVVAGVVQAAAQTITLSAAQLANTTFVAGSGTDKFTVRVSDGITWSAAATGSVVAPTDAAPVVKAVSQTVSHGSLLNASSLFTVTDADHDAIVSYQLVDYTPAAGSGSFVLNGVTQTAGQTITVTADQLSQLKFQTTLGNDTLQVRAFDALDWGAWTGIGVSAVNHAPVVAAPAATIAHGASIAASSLFTTSDADHDAVIEYQLSDLNRAADSGSLVLNGVVQAAGSVVDVTAAGLSSLTFQAGSGADQIRVRAFDGIDWGAWTTTTVTAPVNHAAVVTATHAAFAAHATVSLGSLFATSDADHDAMTQYQIVDYTATASSGHFVVNGVAVAANTTTTLTAAQMAQATYVAGTTGDSISVRAFDGLDWGSWASLSLQPGAPSTQPPTTSSSISTPSTSSPSTSSPSTSAPAASANHAPTVATTNATLAHGASLAVSSLFTASDSDGDAIQGYQVIDMATAADSGHLVVNGVVQTANTTIVLTADQLAHTVFQAGSGADTLQIRATDGTDWSSWHNVTVTAPTDATPVVAAAQLGIGSGMSVAAASLFSVTDADGDTITQYQVVDQSNAASSGHFVVDGHAVAAGTTATLTADQLAHATFQAGTTSDALSIRAFDGIDWGAWTSMTTQTSANQHAPVVSASNQSLSHDTTFAASSLFTAADPDGTPITEYQIYDVHASTMAGHFTLDGHDIPVGQIVDIAASQLSHLTYTTGYGVSDGLFVKALSGPDWSAWAAFSVTPTNAAPILAAATTSVAANATVAASSLFAVSDPDHDVIQSYQLVDWSTSATSGHFAVAGVAQANGQGVEVTAAQLASVTFTNGSHGGDIVYARAYDGHAWGAMTALHV